MNKKRIIALLFIFYRYSDRDNHLSINEILNILAEEYGIYEANRKTIYDDIKILNSFEGINIILDANKYHLDEQLFTSGEIKILIDSLSSLKNVDEKCYQKISKKLSSLLSLHEQDKIKGLDVSIKRTNQQHFIDNVNIILQAINQNKSLNAKIRNKVADINPYFLYRANDYYYLFYTYLDSDRIYKVRFDHLNDIIISDNTFKQAVAKDKILDIINESTKFYHRQNVQKIVLEIIDDGEDTYLRLLDDFSNIIINQKKKLVYLKLSINDVLFSKLTAYQNKIKILEPSELIGIYQDYLNSIIAVYLPPKDLTE